MTKPLEGVRIIDLTHMLSGPYAGMILADLGADSIKVEPLKGEGTRSLLAKDPKNSYNGQGAYFITLNRNKKSICIDLKSEEGLQTFYDLVKESDVVIDNFSAGVPTKLKIGHDHLSEVNPKIITCSVTGFGQDGPNYLRPAFDQVVQGIGGGMSITGHDENHPARAGIPIGDLGGGMFAVMGILAALHSRAANGYGQHVDISMLDCQVSMLNYMATMYFLSGENPSPIGNAHFVHVPYDAYRTSDGFVIIAVIFDSFWENLVELLGIDDLRDPKYKTQPGRFADKHKINGILTDLLETNTTEHWVRLLSSARIPCAPVNKFSDALTDPQVLFRKMVVDIPQADGGFVKAPGNPIKLSKDASDSYTPPPLLGQHTEEVLKAMGYSSERIARLREQKVVG
ncbi:CaiB/BaiF CoA transferase family protein [Marinobacter confluentis]|uniref:CoA transferase n=1 Tax=Marinobacter confluentis TaxID=1697557 RepID=A0A4Z1C1V4_9GAMM|nr:CaiB/BaiF CoA-transferase family protein [Marinobacter confluentis]TGN40141.1 CoA transferase [Marinobacter confluentis]